MRIPHLVPCLICAVGVIPEAKAQEPQRFVSTVGGYSVVFPGPVATSLDTVPLANGQGLLMETTSYAPDGQMVYMSSWTDVRAMMPDGASIKDALGYSRDGFMMSMEATNVKTLALDTTGTRPYIEFSFSVPGRVGKDRIYLIAKSQYALTAIFPDATGVPKRADEFIRSFKLEEPPNK